MSAPDEFGTFKNFKISGFEACGKQKVILLFEDEDGEEILATICPQN